MVDFNNETTISVPAADIVRVLMLQRRNDCIEAREKLMSMGSKGFQVDSSIYRSRLFSYFMELEGMLFRRFEKVEVSKGLSRYAWVLGRLGSKEAAELDEVFFFFNHLLDEIQLTKIDSKKQFDSSRVEIENREKLN